MFPKLFRIYSCFTLLIFILSLNAGVSAQTRKIDELTNGLANSKTDTSKINFLIKLAEELKEIKPSIAENYAKQALQLSEKITDTINIIDSRIALGNVYMYNADYKKQLVNYIIAYELSKRKNNPDKIMRVSGNLGVVYNNLSKIDSSIYYSNLSLALAKNLKNEVAQANAHLGLGLSYIELSEFDKALEQFHNASKLYEKNKKENMLSDCIMNCGAIFHDLGEYNKALDYFERALALKKKTNHKSGIAKALSNIANIMMVQGNFEKALNYHNQSIILKRESEDISGEAMTLMNIGVVYANMEDYTKAKDYFEKSLVLFEKTGNKYNIAQCYNNLGAVHQVLNNIEKAIRFSQKAISVAEEVGAKYLKLEALLVLYDIYKSKGNYKIALAYHEQLVSIQDSIMNEEKSKELTRREMQFDFDKKTSADSIKNSQAKLITDAQISAQKNKLKQEKTLRYALFAGLALVLLFTFFLINRFTLIKRQKNLIEEQKQMVELQRQKVSMANEELQQNNEKIAAQRDEIENQKQFIEEKQKEVIDSITYAKRIQHAILPSIAEVNSYLPESFVLFQPKDIVAGDFYWMHTFSSLRGTKQSAKDMQITSGKKSHRNDGIILIAAADCTGHGVPGAMVSVVCSNALNRAVKEFGLTDPGKILDKVTELVIETFEKSGEEIKDGMDISLLSIETKSKKSEIKNKESEILIKWAGANNPLYFLTDGATLGHQSSKSKKLIEIKADKQPIGKSENRKPFTTHTIDINKGDSVYLFTDGYADQFGGPKGKKLKQKQFKEIITAIDRQSPEIQSKILFDNFNNWKGNLDQVDDVCIIGIKI